ncbi:MAG: hypothetical protein NC419_10075 [Muribaculaceae bacterium]|nr:hypothetical protein [Muribaculaceae bacterium]
MCAVKMDWSKDETLDFAIYNLIVMQGEKEFTQDHIVTELKKYQDAPDEARLIDGVRNFIKYWVDKEILQEHWNTYSLINY